MLNSSCQTCCFAFRKVGWYSGSVYCCQKKWIGFCLVPCTGVDPNPHFPGVCWAIQPSQLMCSVVLADEHFTEIPCNVFTRSDEILHKWPQGMISLIFNYFPLRLDEKSFEKVDMSFNIICLYSCREAKCAERKDVASEENHDIRIEYFRQLLCIVGLLEWLQPLEYGYRAL